MFYPTIYVLTQSKPTNMSKACFFETLISRIDQTFWKVKKITMAYGVSKIVTVVYSQSVNCQSNSHEV